MTKPTLYIGNKAYSSWSLRAWLLLRHAAIPFDEVVIPLAGAGLRTTAILPHSPSGKVPALQVDELSIWDSLAIAEYLAEQFADAALWPKGVAARAVARSVSAEMHSGFVALRTALPMNVRREPAPRAYAQDVADEIARIVAIWQQCQRRFGTDGPFLFGRFSIADAMYAPVVMRFHFYSVALDAGARAYVDTIYALPAIQQWIAEAHREPWRIPSYEA